MFLHRFDLFRLFIPPPPLQVMLVRNKEWQRLSSLLLYFILFSTPRHSRHIVPMDCHKNFEQLRESCFARIFKSSIYWNGAWVSKEFKCNSGILALKRFDYFVSAVKFRLLQIPIQKWKLGLGNCVELFSSMSPRGPKNIMALWHRHPESSDFLGSDVSVVLVNKQTFPPSIIPSTSHPDTD